MASGTIKKELPCMIFRTNQATVTFANGGWTNLGSYAPTEAGYTFKLVTVSGGSTSINVLGIRSETNQAMTAGSGNNTALMGWIGIRNT